MKRAIIVCSGGLDSVTLAHYVKKKLNYVDLYVLFFDYGQNSLILEEKYARLCAKDIGAKFMKVKIQDLKALMPSSLTRKKSAEKISRKDLSDTRKESLRWYLPFRNGLFLSYALAFGENMFIQKKVKPTIFIGFKAEGSEHYPDTTPSFVKAVNNLSSIATQGIKVIAPFIDKDKDDIISLGFKLGVDFSKTISCYIGEKKSCGTCLACMLRKEGFYWANKIDPSIYKN